MNVPVMTNSQGGNNKLPAWLKLADGEKYIRKWGLSCSGEGNARATLAAGVLTAFATIMAGKIESAELRKTFHFSEGSEPWIAVSILATLVILFGALLVWKLARRSSLQAALTNRRMLFRERGRVSEVHLADIKQLKAVDTGSERLVQFFTSASKRSPVASLPVEDPGKVIDEITALATQAGAQFR